MLHGEKFRGLWIEMPDLRLGFQEPRAKVMQSGCQGALWDARKQEASGKMVDVKGPWSTAGLGNLFLSNAVTIT